jgi:hypothetical protein
LLSQVFESMLKGIICFLTDLNWKSKSWHIHHTKPHAKVVIIPKIAY